jgi:hypothetical protein
MLQKLKLGHDNNRWKFTTQQSQLIFAPIGADCGGPQFQGFSNGASGRVSISVAKQTGISPSRA